jgi:hypothetical protein
MRNRLLALTAALGIAALASWTPSAEAIVYYCSDAYCEGKPGSTACSCPPETDKEYKPSNCGEWNSITAIGCWYE